MSGLRFCMVTTFYPPYHFGGDATYVYRLSEALAERGHRVDVVHSKDAYRLGHPGEPEVAFVHHPNVTLHGLESKRPGLTALVSHQLGAPGRYGRQLRRVLEGNPFDVIHYHNVSLMGAPGVLALGRAVKLYTAHEYWLICPTHVLFANNREACVERRCLACTVVHYRRPPQLWRYTGAVDRALRHIDRLIVSSSFSAEQHRAQGIERPMVQLAPLVSRPDAAAALPGPELPERPFFLYVGRLEKLKGVQDLLQLFASYREADLVVAGSGNHAAALREQARGLAHVHFLGGLHPSRLAALYRAAIAVLAPSLCYETFGLTVAEAASHGTPAIVRRIGALVESVEQSGGGYCFTTLEECRAAMESLRTDASLRAELGARAKGFYERNWAPERHLERYLELVESLRAEKAGRRPLEAPRALPEDHASEAAHAEG